MRKVQEVRGCVEASPTRPGDSGKASWKEQCLRGNLKGDENYPGEGGMGWENVRNRRTSTWGGTTLGIMKDRGCPACVYGEGKSGQILQAGI